MSSRARSGESGPARGQTLARSGGWKINFEIRLDEFNKDFVELAYYLLARGALGDAALHDVLAQG